MIHLLVDVVTIRKVPVPSPVTLSATTTTAQAITLKKTAPTRFEGDIPADKDYILALGADASDFWAAGAAITLTRRQGVLQVQGDPNSSLTRAQLQKAGAQTVLKVEFALQKVKDVTSETPPAFGSPQLAWKFDSKVLNPTGHGSTLFNGSEFDTPVFQSGFRMVRWKNGPRVGIYVPKKAQPGFGSYDLFFKPYPSPGWTAVGIVGLYMDWDGQRDHKNFNAATESCGSSYILCLPFPEDGAMPGYGSSASGVVELIEEIDFCLRRSFGMTTSGTSFQVDRIALSCFSGGCDHIYDIFGTPFSALAPKLKGVFIFDGHLNAVATKPKLIPRGQATFSTRVMSWFGGGGDRSLRAYLSQDQFPGLRAGATGGTTTGGDGALEFRSALTNPGGEPSNIYLNAPVAYWKKFDPWYDTWMKVHQAIPKLFLSHAHRYSGA